MCVTISLYYQQQQSCVYRQSKRLIKVFTASVASPYWSVNPWSMICKQGSNPRTHVGRMTLTIKMHFWIVDYCSAFDVEQNWWGTLIFKHSKTILARSGWSGQIHSSQTLLRWASVLSTVVHPRGSKESVRLHLLSVSPTPRSAHTFIMEKSKQIRNLES
jgi:hypothetical protein